MIEFSKKFLYRAFCVVALLVAVYLIIDLQISGTLNEKMMIVFLLLVMVSLWGIIDWKTRNDIIKRQEQELKMYEMYIQPLEELVKEIRAKQHEFDNHKNAILNMHLTINNYEDPVEAQWAYITEMQKDSNSRYIPLLKISDKVLAGFLYSKIVSAKPYIRIDLEVRRLEIISGISEHDLIEVVGTLMDNACEACTQEQNEVMIILDSENDHLVFEIKNQVSEIGVSDIPKFFEKGYSTKDNNRGLGLYNAKLILEKSGGDMTVGLENIGDTQWISFRVTV